MTNCKAHRYKDEIVHLDTNRANVYRVCTKCGFSQYKGLIKTNKNGKETTN